MTRPDIPLCIAFGENARYEAVIRSKLDPRYTAVFCNLSLIDPSDFNLIVPLHLDHYTQLATHGGLNGHKFLAPPAEAVETCHDKLALKSFLVSNGFERLAPAIVGPNDGFPYVIKRRRSEWGQGVRVVRSADDLFEFSSSDWLIEEHLESASEYAYHMLMAGGRSVYQMRSSYEMVDAFQVKGRYGKPARWQYERIPRCDEIFESIAIKLNFTGVLCIDYKMIGGVAKIMEINPRFGGSLMVDINRYLDAYAAAMLPARAGADPAISSR